MSNDFHLSSKGNPSKTIMKRLRDGVNEALRCKMYICRDLFSVDERQASPRSLTFSTPKCFTCSFDDTHSTAVCFVVLSIGILSFKKE